MSENEFKTNYERAENNGDEIEKEIKSIRKFMEIFKEILNDFNAFEGKLNSNSEMLKELKEDSYKWELYQTWCEKKDELKRLYNELSNPETGVEADVKRFEN